MRRTTPIIPTHMPALKMPAIALQLVSVNAVISHKGIRLSNLNLFMMQVLFAGNFYLII